MKITIETDEATAKEIVELLHAILSNKVSKQVEVVPYPYPVPTIPYYPPYQPWTFTWEDHTCTITTA